MKIVDKIILYCTEPRTAAEIAEALNLDRKDVYSKISQLRKSDRLKHCEVSKSDRRMFISIDPFVPIDPENLVIKHAHNPFGLRP
jgi:DNA-binding MarR family transcriptional regulator